MKMRHCLFVLCLLFVSSAGGQAAAQSKDFSDRYDILGIRLGQTLPEALGALNASAPELKIDVRRLHVRNWAGAERCREGGGDRLIGCGSWKDGLTAVTEDRRQEKLDQTNSLVAGIYAYRDTRIFKDEFTLEQHGEDAIVVVVTPTPLQERVVLVSRAKTYPKNAVLLTDLRAQLETKYGPQFTTASSYAGDVAFGIIVQNNRIVSDRNCYYQSQQVVGATSKKSTLQPPLPSSASTKCGVLVIGATARQPEEFSSSYAVQNATYARGFTVTIFDSGGLVSLTSERGREATKLFEVLQKQELEGERIKQLQEKL